MPTKPLEEKQVQEIWKAWTENEQPDLNLRFAYYDGRHAILLEPALNRDGSKHHRIVTNFSGSFVDRQASFATGLPINYTAKDDESGDGLKDLAALYMAEDLSALDSFHYRQSLIFGYSVETVEMDGEDAVFAAHDARQWILIYDNDDNLVHALHFVLIPKNTVLDGELVAKDMVKITVFDDTLKISFKAGLRRSGAGYMLTKIEQDDEGVEHGHGMIPVSVYSATKGRATYLSDDFITLQDGYNSANSAFFDDVHFNSVALLLLSGYDGTWLMTDPDGIDKLRQIKEEGVLPINNDASAEYLNRGSSVEKYSAIKAGARADLHEIGRVPDVASIVGATGSASGIALKLKWQPMTEFAVDAWKYFQCGLRDRLRQLAALALKTDLDFAELDPDKVEITPQINIPENEVETWGAMRTLEGGTDPLISEQTRLRLTPGVDDIEEEQKRLEEDRAKRAASATPPAVPGAEAGQGIAATAETVEEARARSSESLAEKISAAGLKASASAAENSAKIEAALEGAGV